MDKKQSMNYWWNCVWSGWVQLISKLSSSHLFRHCRVIYQRNQTWIVLVLAFCLLCNLILERKKSLITGDDQWLLPIVVCDGQVARRSGLRACTVLRIGSGCGTVRTGRRGRRSPATRSAGGATTMNRARPPTSRRALSSTSTPTQERFTGTTISAPTRITTSARFRKSAIDTRSDATTTHTHCSFAYLVLQINAISSQSAKTFWM